LGAVVSAGNKLSKGVPVPGRQFGARPVSPILSNHLLLIGEIGADIDQGLGLRGETV
jgi:hypothetical protein